MNITSSSYTKPVATTFVVFLCNLLYNLMVSLLSTELTINILKFLFSIIIIVLNVLYCSAAELLPPELHQFHNQMLKTCIVSQFTIKIPQGHTLETVHLYR